MSEIIPHPHQVGMRWGLQTGHTTSPGEAWGRLLSLSFSLFSFLFDFPTRSLLPADEELRMVLS